MSSLLKGFEAGMRLGAPLVEAKLRKREFERQRELAKDERKFRKGENDADRRLRQRLAKDELKQRLLDRQARTSASDADRKLREQLSMAELEQRLFDRQARTSASDADRTQRENIANLQNQLTRTRMRQDQKQFDEQMQFRRDESAKSPMDSWVDGLTGYFNKAAEYQEALANPNLSSEERRLFGARLTAINTVLEKSEIGLNKAMNDGQLDVALTVGDSFFSPRPTLGRGEMGETIAIDPRTGKRIDSPLTPGSPLTPRNTVPGDDAGNNPFPSTPSSTGARYKVGPGGRVTMEGQVTPGQLDGFFDERTAP